MGVKIWWSILQPARRWLLLAPVALLGTFQAIRDEFLSIEMQERLRVKTLLSWLPEWPWEWWLVVGLVIIPFFILEGAYRIISQRDIEISRLNQSHILIAAKRKIVDYSSSAACTTTTPWPVMHADFRPSSKYAVIRLTTFVSTGRSARGENKFTLFRDGLNLADRSDGYLFTVYVPNSRTISSRLFQHFDKPNTTEEIRYSLAFCSDTVEQ
jgi:hypothetical protein